MNQNDEKDMLAGLQAPATPRELKQRVLDAAFEALETTGTPTVWDVLWENRLLRASWAVAIVGLILAHVAISLPATPPRSAATLPPRDQLEDLRGVLDLPSMPVGPRAEALVMGSLPANEPEPQQPAREEEEVHS
jgi:hypothetical protein